MNGGPPKPLKRVKIVAGQQEQLRLNNMKHTASAPQAIRFALHALNHHKAPLDASKITEMIIDVQEANTNEINVLNFLDELNKGKEIYRMELHDTHTAIFTQMGISCDYVLLDEKGREVSRTFGKESKFLLVPSDPKKVALPFGVTDEGIKSTNPNLKPIAVATKITLTGGEMSFGRQVVYLRQDDGTWTMFDDARERAAQGLTDEQIMNLRVTHALYLNQH